VAVLVHGLAVSHRYLMPTARVLSRHYQVHVVDLPGFGLSDAPHHVLDAGEHADALAGWLDANGTGPALLVGNSFGCQVLVDLVIREPRRCVALVLSGPTIDPAAATATRQLLRGLVDLLHEDPVQMPILLRDVRDAGPARVLATLAYALRDPIVPKLALVAVPTLVLRGELEPIVTAAWGSQVADLVPGGRLVTIPASPHNCVYVAAEALSDEVHGFVQSVLHSHASPVADSA
jgi:pimeloyl-ACP methyl ester carboxylesterase